MPDQGTDSGHSDPDLATRKKAARDAYKADRRVRMQGRIVQIKCFWTWPFGHQYGGRASGPFGGSHGCVGCGKVTIYGP